MAQYGTHRINHSYPIQANQYKNMAFLNTVNRLREFENPGQLGTASVRIITNVTASTLTDGTMIANAGAATSVALTFVDQSVCFSLLPKEWNQVNAADVQGQLDAAADACAWQAGDYLIDSWLAGTPTSAQTFGATADINFASDGSDDDNYAVLQPLATCIGVVAEITAADIRNISIAVPYESWGNLWALRGTGRTSSGVIWNDGHFEFMGIAMNLVYSNNAAWAGTDNGTAAVVYHRDSAALGMGNMFLHSGAPIYASDGTKKWIWQQPCCYGAVQSTFSEVMNEST
jgi:hypothetical protein